MPDLSGLLTVGMTLLRKGRTGSTVEVIVTKVGRKLVTVSRSGDPNAWDAEQFRIENGQRNDNYGHTWVTTVEQDAALQESCRLSDELHDLGIRFELGKRYTIQQKQAIIDILTRESSEG